MDRREKWEEGLTSVDAVVDNNTETRFVKSLLLGHQLCHVQQVPQHWLVHLLCLVPNEQSPRVSAGMS